jgi:RNA recognition motif-containing protein
MTNLFVGNLSYQTTDTDLEQAFSEYGTVERASVVRDRDTGQSRGFGFVEMPDRNQAEQAINGLNGRELNGRALNVNEARPREATGGGNRGGSKSFGGGKRRPNRY